MGTIKYSTTLCNFSKGEKPCYLAHVKHNGTIDQDAFLESVAELSGESKERVRFAWDLALAEIRRQLKSGNRIELEQLAVGVAVQGTFSAANAAWDASKNRLVPYVNAKGELKAEFTEQSSITLYDFETKTTRTIDADGSEGLNNGHGGGDEGIIYALYDYLVSGETGNAVPDIAESFRNHMLVFAAERSRHDISIVDVDEYIARR